MGTFQEANEAAGVQAVDWESAGHRTQPGALIGKALFCDAYALDSFPVLSGLPLIARWAEAHPRELLPRGKALQVLLRRAVSDVATFRLEGDAHLARVSEFTRMRFAERQRMTAIAAEWGVDRSYLHRTVGRPALELVTRRFVQLVSEAWLRASVA